MPICGLTPSIASFWWRWPLAHCVLPISQIDWGRYFWLFCQVVLVSGCLARCFSSGIWSWLSLLCDQGTVQDVKGPTVGCNCRSVGFSTKVRNIGTRFKFCLLTVRRGIQYEAPLGSQHKLLKSMCGKKSYFCALMKILVIYWKEYVISSMVSHPHPEQLKSKEI